MMKVIPVLVVFLLLSFSSNTDAQSTDWGLKFGVNLSSFTGNDASDLSRKTGFLGGGYFEKRIGSATVFRFEALYSQKGNKETDIIRKINYLDLPLTVKVHPSEIRPLNIFVIGGLNPSFKLSGNTSYSGSYGDRTETIENLKDFDIGYVVGWGIFYARGDNRTTLEMRFVQSLDSIYADNQFLDIKNSTITFLIGTNFRQII